MSWAGIGAAAQGRGRFPKTEQGRHGAGERSVRGGASSRRLGQGRRGVAQVTTSLGQGLCHWHGWGAESMPHDWHACDLYSRVLV